MSTTYSALDSIGFVKEPTIIAERLLADYLSTNFSQNPIFFGQCRSLSNAVKSNTNDMDGTAKQIERELTELYGASLDNVTVNVEAAQINDASGYPTAMFEIIFRITYGTANGLVELSKTIKTTNEGVSRIATITGI